MFKAPETWVSLKLSFLKILNGVWATRPHFAVASDPQAILIETLLELFFT